MDNLHTDGESQQKEDSSKRHTYPLIKVGIYCFFSILCYIIWAIYLRLIVDNWQGFIHILPRKFTTLFFERP